MTRERITERRAIQSIRRMTAEKFAGVRVGIGDDAAVLEPKNGALLLATTDLLIEGTHFRRRYAEPADIGWKALAVNLSDIAAMGGRPRWALIALACPADTSLAEVDAFYEGVLTLAAEHQVAVVGGDTAASPTGWIVNVTLVGDVVGTPLLRSTAKVGDAIAVTGTLGASRAGLAIFSLPAPPAALPSAIVAEVTAAHLRPRPRVREGQWLAAAGGVTAMIDLSDGLATDLGHIVEESAVGARVDLERVPVSESVRHVAHALGHDALAWGTSGGEDYELLLTCEPHALARLRRGLEEATGTPLIALGEIASAQDGIRFVDAQGCTVPAAPGFEHFITGR